MTDLSTEDFDPALDALLRLPRFTPSSDFADRVMARVAVRPRALEVPVTIPPRPVWDAARGRILVPAALKPAREPVRWLPESRPIRYAAAALAATAGLSVTGLTVLALTQLDLVTLIGTMAVERVGMSFAGWASGIASSVFGSTAMGYLQATGSPEGALTVAGLAAGAYATMAGIRAAAATGNRVI